MLRKELKHLSLLRHELLLRIAKAQRLLRGNFPLVPYPLADSPDHRLPGTASWTLKLCPCQRKMYTIFRIFDFLLLKSADFLCI